MRLRSKSKGGWVGVVGAIHIACRSLNHTHVLKITDMTVIPIPIGYLYFSFVTYQQGITAYIAITIGFHLFNCIAMVCDYHLSCD